LLPSFGTEAPAIETDKWLIYIGREIKVHSDDYSIEENTFIKEIDPLNDSNLIVDPPLSFAPSLGYIVDICNYEEAEAQENLYKNLHVFFDPQATVTSGVSETVFNVSLLDAAKMYVGSIVRVHNDDYSIDSGDVVIRVTDISGTQITVDTDLGFVPASGQAVDLIGFTSDNGKPYVWL
jgi:hypothetical protein